VPPQDSARRRIEASRTPVAPGGRESAAVVTDLDAHGAAEAEVHAAVTGAGVPHDVGDGLLGDPVGGHLDARVHPQRFARR
jgi:hypothetical protein